MSSIILNYVHGKDVEAYRANIEREIEREKANINQNTQAIQSGQRVIRQMSGMMRLLANESRK